MQRPISSSRASDDHYIIVDEAQQSQARPSPRNRMEGVADLPTYETRSGARRREISRSRSSEKVIHVIPVIVLLCIFILWWFSYPVNLEIKDGRIIAVHQIEKPQPLNDTHVDLTILALATPPNDSVFQILSSNNETTPQPVYETTALPVSEAN